MSSEINDLIIALNDVTKIINIYSGKGMPIEMIDNIIRMSMTQAEFIDRVQNYLFDLLKPAIPYIKNLNNSNYKGCTFCGDLKFIECPFSQCRYVSDYRNIRLCEKCNEKYIISITNIVLFIRKLYFSDNKRIIIYYKLQDFLLYPSNSTKNTKNYLDQIRK